MKIQKHKLYAAEELSQNDMIQKLLDAEIVDSVEEAEDYIDSNNPEFIPGNNVDEVGVNLAKEFGIVIPEEFQNLFDYETLVYQGEDVGVIISVDGGVIYLH